MKYVSGMGVYSLLAGNGGTLGPWYAAAPATGKDVISVGSVDKFVTGLSPWNLTKQQVNSTMAEGLPNPDPRGVMSSFSSLGPTYELDFKPAVCAPGRDIFSTLPKNSFGTGTGTTLAS